MNKFMKRIKENLATITFLFFIAGVTMTATVVTTIDKISIKKEEIIYNRICYPELYVSKIKNTQNTFIACTNKDNGIIIKIVE